MYKLIFFMIVISIGFSTIAKAQNVKNSVNTETLKNHKSKDFKDTSKEIIVSKNQSLHKVGHNENSEVIVVEYKSLKKIEGILSTHSHSHILTHENIIPFKKNTDLKYTRIKNVKDSIKIEKKHLIKDN